MLRQFSGEEVQITSMVYASTRYLVFEAWGISNKFIIFFLYATV